MIPAKSAVTPPTTADDAHRPGARRKRTLHRATSGAPVDHRRRVDQGGDRSRARHGVRKPDVERDLRALADGAEEEAEADDRQVGRVFSGIGGCGGKDPVEVERVKEGKDPEHPEQEPEVPDAVDDECLLAGVGRVLAVVVVADQEIGAEAHAFPADEQEQEVLGEDEGQHREHEEVQVREVAGVAGLGLVVPHVADGIDVDPEPDESHETRHQRGQGIETEREVGGKAAGGDPGSDPLDDRGVIGGQERDEPQEGDPGREPDGARADGGDEALAESLSQQAVDGEAREGKRGDDPERKRHACPPLSLTI
jgi:hypothetical protein